MVAKFLERLGHSSIPANKVVPGVALDLFVPKGGSSLEVLHFSAKETLRNRKLRDIWQKRREGNNTPTLVVASSQNGCMLCGPIGPKPPVYTSIDYDWAEQMCDQVLYLPTDRAAISFIDRAFGSHEDGIPGLSNEGMFAIHTLKESISQREDWNEAQNKAGEVRKAADKNIFRKLGFTVEDEDSVTSILYDSNDVKTALAITLKEHEYPDDKSERCNNLSPVSYALAKADKERLPWVLTQQQGRLRLYATENIGVAKRARTETYVECQIALLQEDAEALLWLLFSADALKDGGTARGILSDSERFSGKLAESLRERVYDIAVPELAMGIVEAQQGVAQSHVGGGGKHDSLKFSYRLALTVLFRLLFLAFAEDRDLLPYRENYLYKKYSLKSKANELANDPEGAKDSTAHSHWNQTAELWNAFNKGNAEWGVPVYNGSLFSSDPEISTEGAALEKIHLPNARYAKALRAILLTTTDEHNSAPVDFRSLGTKELGTIYEGLLESELAIAEQDLFHEEKGGYRPACGNEVVKVAKDTVYVHSMSGTRKSTGSYYTPDFIVNHLLDRALDPAIDNHLERLSNLAKKDANAVAEKFFDLRVADISMGSGHFLIGAIDRIERRLSKWLIDNPNASVLKKLSSLRAAASETLREANSGKKLEDIDDSQLLRRSIARKCIYGIDLNPLAVELARVSVWMHTFVPGLPFTLLDNQLVRGNALVGIDTLSEISRRLNEKEQKQKLSIQFKELGYLESLQSKPAALVQKFLELDDASASEISIGRHLMHEKRIATLQCKTLCDLLLAHQIATKQQKYVKQYQFEHWSKLGKYWKIIEENQQTSSDTLSLACVTKYIGTQDAEDPSSKFLSQTLKALHEARELLEPHFALHFPVIFPEVFATSRHGFDAVIGNPPWERTRSEEKRFWARLKPGINAVKPAERNKIIAALCTERPNLRKQLEREQSAKKQFSILLKGTFPEIGVSDLYHVFCWRMLQAVSCQKGWLGLVMPRSGLVSSGNKRFRKELFSNFTELDIVNLRNGNRWVFEDVEGRYEISLLAAKKETIGNTSLRATLLTDEEFKTHRKHVGIKIDNSILLDYNMVPALPLPLEESWAIVEKMHQSSALGADIAGNWRAVPNREMSSDSKVNKLHGQTSKENQLWDVWAGESFTQWTLTDKFVTKTLPRPLLEILQKTRLNANRNSAFSEFTPAWREDKETHPVFRARIAYRRVTCNTNRRTLICALIPPKVFLTDQAPYFLFPRGDEKDECYLLAVLSSLCLDWYSRRFIVMHPSREHINSLPIPRCDTNREEYLRDRIIGLAGQLACPDTRFSVWAGRVGVRIKKLDPTRKEKMICELEAMIALLYGLSKAQLGHIFDTFHPNGDHNSRREPTLEYYAKIQSASSSNS